MKTRDLISWAGIAAILGGIVGIGMIGTNALLDAGRVPALKPAPALITVKTKVPFNTVAPIFQNKCADCHVSNVQKPFYAMLPVASQVIGADVKAGLQHFNLQDELFNEKNTVKPGKKPVSEATLAKLEFVLQAPDTSFKAMPPPGYTALHWQKNLSEAEKISILSWVASLRETALSTGKTKFPTEPVQPLEALPNLNAEKVALGKVLYHDVRLSGDNTLSCASCHALNRGGTDQAKVSTGIRGQKGPINSPTVYNAALNVRQFWDGRAGTLEEQAHGPVNNPIEMGSNWASVIKKLEKDPALVAKMKQLYPGKAPNDPKAGLKPNNIANAIATFEQSLVTENSVFDRYLRTGNEKLLPENALKGYKKFVSIGCASCHVGPAVGGQSFEYVRPTFFQNRTLTEADNGMMNFTKLEKDQFKFKVPTLRNIAVTYPYFHDGSAKTLKEAVQRMAKSQLGVTLNKEDTEAIVVFLNTLSGEYEGKPLATSPMAEESTKQTAQPLTNKLSQK